MLSSVRDLLDFPSFYSLWWNAVGGLSCSQQLISEYVQPVTGSRVLEIGCGPGTLTRYFQQCEYLGFDISSKYIEMANKRFPRAQFTCGRVSEFSAVGHDAFDTVLGIGVVHHIDDGEAKQLFELAYKALKPGGKLVTCDGVWTENQSRGARWFLARDRGKFVRTEKEYVGIASQVFSHVKSTIRVDLLRIPYSHLILECSRR
jgi:cyclopropane fatty-acyl-phospholipid synthase-like methyltransferase